MPNINATMTFGLELEVVKLTLQARDLMTRHHLSTYFDRSIKGRNGEDLPESIEDGGGAEIISQPLNFQVRSPQDGRGLSVDLGASADTVRAMCECAAEVNKSCGLHIHLGRPVGGRPVGGQLSVSAWQPEHTRTMLLIGLFLEDRLFSVCPPSRRNSSYCRPIRMCYTAEELGSYYPMGTVNPGKYQNPKRYCWLNTVETRRDHPRSPHTIEVRMLGSVRRFDYILAWTKLWCKIAAYVAHVPSSLAMMHCCFSGSLDSDFAEIKRVREERVSRLAEQAPQPAIQPTPAEVAQERDAFERDLQRIISDEQSGRRTRRRTVARETVRSAAQSDLSNEIPMPAPVVDPVDPIENSPMEDGDEIVSPASSQAPITQSTISERAACLSRGLRRLDDDNDNP